MIEKCYYCGFEIEPDERSYIGPKADTLICESCDYLKTKEAKLPGLRDHFAGLAMQSLIMNPNFISRAAREGGMKPVESISVASYEMADAMLKQRNKT